MLWQLWGRKQTQNDYIVKAYLNLFHEVELGTKIRDCEFGFDDKRNQYFLSMKVSADSVEEARRKGERRLNQVLSVFVIHTGVSYTYSSIGVDQISGEQPFFHHLFTGITRLTYLPINNEKIAEVEKSIEILDKLADERVSIVIERAINYFLRGCYLETRWRSESFLNFYKVIELVAQEFRGSFNQTVARQLSDTLFSGLTEQELKRLRTLKRLMKFMCKQLDIASGEDISRIITLRSKFSAHAVIEEVVVSPEEFNSCKVLAGRTMINYIKQQALA